MSQKTCSRCKQLKDVSEFGLDRRVTRERVGLKSICRPCDSEIHRERFAKLKNQPDYIFKRPSRAEYARARNLRRKESGICFFCKTPALAGKTRCLEHNERAKYLQKVRSKRWLEAARAEAMQKYGGARCACCGETTEKFLTMDHINDDGGKHRRSLGGNNHGQLYSWFRMNNYPPGFQVLCYNCNCGRYRNGGICPHKQVAAQ